MAAGYLRRGRPPRFHMIKQPETRAVVVLRSFLYRGAPTKVGERLVLANGFAHELRHAGKAEFVDAEPQPVAVAPPAPAAAPHEVTQDAPALEDAPVIVKKGRGNAQS